MLRFDLITTILKFFFALFCIVSWLRGGGVQWYNTFLTPSAS